MRKAGDAGMTRTAALPRRTGWRLLFAALAAFAGLVLSTKSSFLYPLNDWVDVQCFFTVGRGVVHGLMPYRDLYEQKGPLVYLLYALGAAISENSFVGVFVVECLCFAAFLHLCGKIAETLTGLRGAYWPGAALPAVLIPLSPAFSHGGSAEELILPVFALGLWLVLRVLGRKDGFTDGEGIALGLCAAAALWMKYTFCGLFLGLALVVLAWHFATGRAAKLPRLIGCALLGTAGLSALILGWFALRGALPELWQAYFVNNLSQYSQNIRGGAYDPPLQNLLNNLTWAVPAAAGLIWLTATGRKRGWEAAACWLGAVCLFVFTYWSGRRYPYYALVMAAFTPLGIAALIAGAARLLREKPAALRGTAIAFTAAAIAAAPLTHWAFGRNSYMLAIPREETPQYRFARIIRDSDNPSLLNTGFLDGGFYYAAGLVPENRFFCTFNIDLPEMQEEMDRSLREGRTAFVVTRQRRLEEDSPYELVDEHSMLFEGRPWTYYLYRRKTAGD